MSFYSLLFRVVIRKLFLALVLFIPAAGMAQSDLALYSMRSLPQVTRSNPAITPYSRVNVSLPLMNCMGQANSNQFALGKFLQADPFASADVWQEAARRTFRSIYEDLEEENNIFASNIEIDLLSFGFKLGWNYFYFRSSERVSLDFRYPRSLFDLFNPDIDLQGENIVLSGTDLSALHYREYALTYSRKLLPSLTVGATAKYLCGMDAIRGDNCRLLLQVLPISPV